MKWLRWWHLLPLFVIMMGCLGYFGKTKMIDPAEAAYKAALADFTTARDAAKAKEGDYKKAFEDRPGYCKEFIADSKAFNIIQQAMPNIHCMYVEYANNKEEGLRKWYYDMGKGLTLNELRRWVKKFPAQKRPTFEFTGTLGFAETLPSATIVKIAFDEQTVRVRGYNELQSKIANMTGYGFCPYVIKFVGTSIAAAPAAAPAAGAPGAAPPAGGAPAAAPAPATPPAAAPAAPTKASINSNSLIAKVSSRLNNRYHEPYQGYYIAGGFNPNMRFAQAAPPPSTGGPPAGAPAAGAPAGGAPPAGAPAAGAPAGGAPAAGAPAAGAPAPAAGGGAGALTIKVIKEINGKNVYDPVRPILEFKYTAEAYFMTQSWDPYGDGSKAGVKTKVDEAMKVLADPGTPKKGKEQWTQPLPPPMLWFIPFPEPSKW